MPRFLLISKHIFFCLIILFANNCFARDAISLGYGNGTAGVRGYRANWQHEWSTINVTPNKRKLTGYWELGYTNIHGTETYEAPTNDHTQAVSASAVLRIPYRLFLNWYIDLGIGVAYFTDQQIATRNLGSKWDFEDRAGIGILLGAQRSFEVGYRFVHFSNAYLAQKNQGLNLHLLILGYWFN